MAEPLQMNTLVLDTRRLSMNLVQVHQNIRQVVGEAPKVEGFAEALEKSKLAELDVGALLKGEGLAAPFVSGIKAALAFEQYLHDLELGPQQNDPLENTGLNRQQAAGLLPQAGLLQSKEHLEQLQGAIQGVTLAFGLALLPAFNTLAQAVTPLLQGLAELLVLHPGLVEGVGAAAAAFTVMRITATAAMLALSVGPLGLLVGAITLAVGLIIANWDTLVSTTRALWDGLGAWFVGLWAGIQGAARVGWEGLKEVVSWHPLLLLANNWEKLPEWVGKVIEVAAELLARGWARVRAEFGWSPLPSLEQAWAGVGEFFTTLQRALAQQAGAAWASVSGLFERAIAFSLNLNWEDVDAAFAPLWAQLTAIRERFAGWAATLFDGDPLAALEQVWGTVAEWFRGWWEQLTPIIEAARAFFSGDFGAALKGAIDTVGNWGKEVPQEGQPASEVSPPVASGLTPGVPASAPPPSQGLVRQTADAQRTAVDGSILVRFENPPAGLAVVATQSNQPGLSIRSNVGVRSLSQGVPA